VRVSCVGVTDIFDQWMEMIHYDYITYELWTMVDYHWIIIDEWKLYDITYGLSLDDILYLDHNQEHFNDYMI